MNKPYHKSGICSLSTLTPDKQDEVEFEVQASISISDESDVGLSKNEVTIETWDLKITKGSANYSNEALEVMINEMLDNHDFDPDIQEQLIDPEPDPEDLSPFDAHERWMISQGIEF